MNYFNAQLVTLRKLFKNEYDDVDRTKNYYIPLYQRQYKWAENHISKLIEDINDLYTDQGIYTPYFMGGIVLSRESIEGDERSKVSLEVIDGQQRLTTLAIIFAVLVQILKFGNRKYPGKEEFIESLIEDLSDLVISKRFTVDYKVEKVLKVERSDKIKTIYTDILQDLVKKEFNIENHKTSASSHEEKNFLKNVYIIYQHVDLMEDNRILHFTLQLLDHTQIVVTKTDSIDTGYTVFEKLNDSGEGLMADDLLKNYLFSIKTDDEDSKELQTNWEEFIEQIRKINPRSHISAKEFLENYLIVIGHSYKSSKTSDIFSAYKYYFMDSRKSYMDVLNNMNNIAIKFTEIRNNNPRIEILNKMNFKLGFLIFLTFYNKFSDSDYQKYEIDILKIIFKFGYIYLLTGKAKYINKIITSQCKNIAESQENISKNINSLNENLQKLILKSKGDFSEQLSSNNRYKRSIFTKILLDVINFHLGGTSKNDKFSLVRIMPENYESFEYHFHNINEDNYIKYANYLGNLTLLSKDNNKLCSNWDEEEKTSCIFNHSDLLINKTFQPSSLENSKYKEYFSNLENEAWGKSMIIQRTDMLTSIALNIFIDDQFDIAYFD